MQEFKTNIAKDSIWSNC